MFKKLTAKVVGRTSLSGIWIRVFLNEAVTTLGDKEIAQTAPMKE